MATPVLLCSRKYLRHQISRFLDDQRGFPGQELVQSVQETGRHSLSTGLVEQLRVCRDRVSLGTAEYELLQCLLDKHENRFDYHSYLALPVLDLIDGPTGAPGKSMRVAALLLADLVRFEVDQQVDGDRRMPNRRPDGPRLARRLRHARRLAGQLSGEVGDTASHSRALDTAKDELPTSGDRWTERCLRYSLLPVGTEHDEYLFIRVIQAYEMVFKEIEHQLSRATALAQQGDVTSVSDTVDQSARTLNDAATLFSLLATMRAESFREFRELTAGAGAIQSETYKQIELLCGIPTARRLASSAFRSVPGVRKRALEQPDSLASWYLRSAETFTDSQRERVELALANLERAHQRWKRTHHTLAAAMIGEKPGSGHTDGVSYLQECLDNRLFWEIGLRCPSATVHRAANDR